MNLSFLDWSIVVIVLGLMVFSVMASKSLMRSVADFLAAGRSAGRYVLTMATGVAGLGAITIVANLEMNLVAGFSMAWWGMTMGLVILIIKVSGWVVYRFRQTRCLTMAQFFEMRYSRKFRIFTGIVAFIAGLINFGIFPAVGARFFLHFCGIPLTVDVFGIDVSTYALTMIVLLSISLYFVFSGGQIAVIIADFFQGAFVNIVFVITILYFFFTLDWGQIQAALSTAPENASLINPFKTSHVEDFNFWFFLIAVVGNIYGPLSWQGTQGYNASARSAHEAKMAGVLDGWRGLPQVLMFLFIPVVAYCALHHPDFSHIASGVEASIQGIEGEAIQNQLKVPMFLSMVLPKGLIGAFVAVMLAAFISTHDTYLHSWGSIFIQDVVMPFRKKPFSKKQHLRVLRVSIISVAIFIFTFSMLFTQSEYIFLFFAITGAIFLGGSGAVIIGGLYWKRGTKAGAWAAMITGSTIAIAGIVIHQINPDFFINGQVFYAISMGGAIGMYILFSLLGKRSICDLDKILNRGKYARTDELKVVSEVPEKGWKILGMGKEFTRGDKFIYILNYVWSFGWTAIFIFGTIYNLTHEVSNDSWMAFWAIFIKIHVFIAVIVIFWFIIGGIKDLRAMILRLKTMERDDSDDGFIRNQE
ncbi:sodium:solute symporter [candidate division LCP-89 bacterium B3_LCP]|uniref:Sodium:solute symporter n=1 Tax=candidate division LCP-89 bacterium B3_LCP TaxID=2012998 RepID=A0A532USJ4_UNCL8|nr:MAG: sodium:solute symporter [candidate division LCP-89 bacterium B3_LCP]